MINIDVRYSAKMNDFIKEVEQLSAKDIMQLFNLIKGVKPFTEKVTIFFSIVEKGNFYSLKANCKTATNRSEFNDAVSSEFHAKKIEFFATISAIGTFRGNIRTEVESLIFNSNENGTFIESYINNKCNHLMKKYSKQEVSDSLKRLLVEGYTNLELYH